MGQGIFREIGGYFHCQKSNPGYIGARSECRSDWIGELVDWGGWSGSAMQSSRWAAPLGVFAPGSVFAASLWVLVSCGRSTQASQTGAAVTDSNPPMVTVTQNTSSAAMPDVRSDGQ